MLNLLYRVFFFVTCKPLDVALHAWCCSLINKKQEKRFDDCIKYTIVAGKKALAMAGLEKESNSDAYSKLDLNRCGVIVGSGMGGLTVFA